MTPPEIIPSDEAHAIFAAIRDAAFDKKLLEGVDPRPGWQRARVDPLTVIAAAPGVELDPGWQIIAYQFYSDMNAKGSAFAVRNEDADAAPVFHDNGLLEPPSCAAPSILVALRPSGDAVSFFARSLVMRELSELCSLWHGVRWGANELVAGASDLPEPRDRQAPWSWEGPALGNVNPVVEVLPGAVRVIFYTRPQLGPARIIEHTDVHSLRDGLIVSEERVVASGQGGGVA